MLCEIKKWILKILFIFFRKRLQSFPKENEQDFQYPFLSVSLKKLNQWLICSFLFTLVGMQDLQMKKR